MTISTYAVDTVGLIDFPDGADGPGVILATDIAGTRAAAKMWGSRVVLLGVEDLEGLAERIEEVLSDANDMDVTFADFALHVACDLLGKDVDEAYRARREAKDAAA